jgi:hypothetical protein
MPVSDPTATGCSGNRASSGTPKYESTARLGGLGVLGFTVAEGPVLLFHLNEADDDVFAAQADPPVQAVGHRPVEVSLGFRFSPFVERHLYQHGAGGPVDPKVGGVDDEAVMRVLGDDHEAVIFGASSASTMAV